MISVHRIKRRSFFVHTHLHRARSEIARKSATRQLRRHRGYVPADREYIGATDEEAAKKRHFLCRRGGSHNGELAHAKRRLPIIGPGRCLLAFELSKHGFKLRLLGSERGKPGPDMLNLLVCHAVAINVPDSSLLQAQCRFACEGDAMTAPMRASFKGAIFHRRRPIARSTKRTARRSGRYRRGRG